MQPCQQSHCSISPSKKERIPRSSPKNKRSILPSKTNGNKNPPRKPPSQRFPPRLPPAKENSLPRPSAPSTLRNHRDFSLPNRQATNDARRQIALRFRETKIIRQKPASRHTKKKERKERKRQSDNDKSAQRGHCAFVPDSQPGRFLRTRPFPPNATPTFSSAAANAAQSSDIVPPSNA